MSEYIQVTTSVDSEQRANDILQALLQARLAACGHVCSPMKSSYWWHGKIENATEYSCVVKTRTDLFMEIEKLIKSMHSYEEPEILAVPIVLISESYRQWMDKELKK